MPAYDEEQARAAVAASCSYAETLRRLGLRAAGGNFRVLKRWLERWDISTDHFDPYARRRGSAGHGAPLESYLVTDLTYSRHALKRRLYVEGYKERRCELCGQGEIWRGRPMALILDHINGIGNDNRLENLQVVCPNCAATLDTHCGRNERITPRPCAGCDVVFTGRTGQRYCSTQCAGGARRGPRPPRPETRRVERPPYGQLRAEIAADGWSAVGRRYGVSDNTVRKWMRMYEREEPARERPA